MHNPNKKSNSLFCMTTYHTLGLQSTPKMKILKKISVGSEGGEKPDIWLKTAVAARGCAPGHALSVFTPRRRLRLLAVGAPEGKLFHACAGQSDSSPGGRGAPGFLLSRE